MDADPIFPQRAYLAAARVNGFMADAVIDVHAETSFRPCSLHFLTKGQALTGSARASGLPQP